jgi:hypothetical protein
MTYSLAIVIVVLSVAGDFARRVFFDAYPTQSRGLLSKGVFRVSAAPATGTLSLLTLIAGAISMKRLRLRTRAMRHGRWVALLLVGCTILPLSTAQINVTTYHYDNFRRGQNTAETVLTLSNVNSTQFGKLFSVAVDGYVYAQPLYLAKVVISGAVHNVLYIATEHDSVYAIDADKGTLLWQQSFINPAANITTVPSSDWGCNDLIPEIGITSTPVIDPVSGTIYVLAKTQEGAGSANTVQRLHALDVVTHAEKFGGPKLISATIQGRTFSAHQQHNRPGLLLENGHIVIAWASHCDSQPYQGWVMSYNASTLAQEAVFNTELNTTTGFDGGIWMSGDGVAADANGNLYLPTGNGDYDGTSNFGDTILKLSGPTNGALSVADWFTPFNQSTLNGGDTDLGSGGILLLPDLPAGSAHQQLLIQMGKEGKLYLIDRNNMGKFCSTCASIGIDTNIVQEIPGATGKLLGSPTFWNNTVFWGGTGHPLRAWSFNANNSGVLSTSPTSQTPQSFLYPGPTPVVSANGTSNGILWALDNSSASQILYAYNASNLGEMLYNSNQAANGRDVPGGRVKFSAPVIANGKVYVGSQATVSAFGLLSSTPIAVAPTFSPAPGSYASAVTVTLSDTTPGATIHCTTDGSTPLASSPVCSTVTISSTTLLQAIAVASGYTNSPVTSGTYSIGSGSGINYGTAFTSTGLALNGSATVNGTRLRLTDGGSGEAGSAFSTTLINVQSFTTDFSFQLTNPTCDGITFVLQNTGTTALGSGGGGLGYAGIGKSVAVKFDLCSNSGEGSNSTGLYTNGAPPTIPAITLGGGVNLHNGDIFKVHLSYAGTTLNMTITDTNVPADTFTTSWPINIPSTVGANTAFAGFTGGTGALTATQEIISWTFNSVAAQPIQYEAETVPSTGVPDHRVFSWVGFTDGLGIIVDATQAGNYIAFTLNVPQSGTYAVKYASKTFPSRGLGQLSIGGVNVGPVVDQYNANTNGVWKEFDVRNVTFSVAGNYQFVFTVTGKNSSSSGYTLAFDYIKLTPQ